MLLGLPDFDMLSAGSVDEACALLAEYGRDARVFAGGTDLLTRMKLRRLLPRTLINIKGIPGLDQIRSESHGGLRIGALATIQSIKDSALVSRKCPMLSQAAGVLGTTQIRNLGTLGGNLANASPSAEFGPPLLTLEASVRSVARGTERSIPVSEFFLSPGKCALRQDELLAEVLVPEAPHKAQAIYLKHSLRRMDVSIAGAAVLVVLDADVCQEARIALGAVAPIPFRAEKAEALLRGQRLAGDSSERELLEEVARVASGEARPIDDLRGYAAYRSRIVGMLVKQGLEQVIARARGRRPE